MILGDAARLCTAGILLGAAAAWLAASSMRALLAGVNPADLPTFAAAVALCAPHGAYRQPRPGVPRHPNRSRHRHPRGVRTAFSYAVVTAATS